MERKRWDRAVGGELNRNTECVEGATYAAYVWGRTWELWNSETNWVGEAYDGHTEICPTELVDPTGGPATE